MKLNFEKMAEAINYGDVQPTFYKKDGEHLTEEDLLSKNLCPDDDWPFYIKDFKRLKLGFSHVIYDCSDDFMDDKKSVLYLFDNKEKSITIETDTFTIKEFITIINMIDKHLKFSKSEQFIAFGNDNDETHKLFHGESTADGMWWKDFYDLYIDRINGLYKLKRIHIQTEDYQNEEEGWYNKNRVIRIILE